MCDLSAPKFHDENKARTYLEKLRWPDGPVCPYCGSDARPVRGKSMGKGWFYCPGCREKFTVRVGTVMERSKIPLHKWVAAMHLMAASKKGVSAHQLYRMLGITYKSAWFLAHRIREAMKEDHSGPMDDGGSGKVQADETYFGSKAVKRTHTRDGRPYLTKGGGGANKRAVVSLISGGKARTFHVKSASAQAVRDLLTRNARREWELHTDESGIYKRLGEEFKAHKTVNHSRGEYVKKGVTTNAVENYFSVFKRGMKGVYQHCAEKHLQRYITEFDFRYNNRGIDDFERAEVLFKQAEGKRLTYRRTHEAANA